MELAEEMVRCSQCGQINRVRSEKLERGMQPKCGNCKASLLVRHGPVTVNDASFRDMVENSDLPVLVDFWAPWCGPCHALAPVIEELASEFSGKIRVGKLNTDENPKVAGRFRIRSIPTMILFRNGQEIDRMTGVLPKQAIAGRIRAHL